MKKQKIKRIAARCTASMLAAGMIVGNVAELNVYAAQAGAADVEEKLYVNLDDYGKVEKANIVKGVQFAIDDSYTDYGNYTSITNMSDNQEPVVKGNSVTWMRPDGNGKFYFQGGLDPTTVKMPWDFTVTYKVNGIVTPPEKVAGASGTVEVDIDAVPNKNVNKYMQNNMVLLVLIPMDQSKVYSTDAPESMQASFGNYSGVGFEALPGQEKHFQARFGTDSFESMGVMMVMTPVTAGDISKIKDFKELEDKFRANTNEVMDSVDAIMDNVTDMSSQLAKTNQMLDQLASGKAKIDQNRTIIFDGVDLSLQDVRDLTELLDPVDTSLKTTQWMVYDINTNLNDTNNHLASTSAVMSTLSRKLRALSSEMGSTNTFDISSVSSDLELTKSSLNELRGNLAKSGLAVKNIKTITGSDDFKNETSDAVTEGAMADTNIDGAYLPSAVIGYINGVVQQKGGSSNVSENDLKGLIPDIAKLIYINNALAAPNGTTKYSVTTEDLAEAQAALKKAQAAATDPEKAAILGAYASAFVGKVTGDNADIPLIANNLGKIIAPGALDSATATATEFVDHMVSMLNLKGTITELGNDSNKSYGGATANLQKSLNDLSEFGSDALANAITAYGSIDYATAIDQINQVMSDIDDVMDAGASVSYQTSRLLDSMRKVTADVDSLISTLNSYYEDVQTAITNVSNVVEQTEKTADDLTRTAQTLNDTLRAASEDLSAAGDTGIAIGREAVDNSNKMIENTKNMKEAGADLRKSINDKLDEEEADNNFINMDPDAEAVSLTSTANVEPSSISIICRTAEIKINDDDNATVDAEFPEQKTTFLSRVANVFKALFSKIKGIFVKS